jgi:soluble lytic murein transglycosylase-like protein
MSNVKTSRPFQERFLDGFDRSQLRVEVQKVKPRRSQGLRRKYATLALGASLAFAGLGVPMKMIQDAQHSGGAAELGAKAHGDDANRLVQTAIDSDLQQSKSIADQVAGGVKAVAGGVQAAAATVESAASVPLQVAVQAPQQLRSITEQVRQRFFNTQVPFGSIIYSEAKKNDLPPELVAAVVNTESKFIPTARSNRGAVGLMQLVPRTGRWMGAQNLTNPAQNISAGAKYLRYLTDRFDGDQQKAIAAYNAGEGNVRRFNGVPPYRETRNYVQRVRSFQQDLGDRLQGQIADLGAASE